MSSSTSASACCMIAVLNQRQEALRRQHQPQKASANLTAKPTKTCTVVENGRVVVKPIFSAGVQELG